MMDWNERIEQIQKRSQAMLQQRRQKRRRILGVCIPLALCLVVAIPFIWPAITANQPVREVEELPSSVHTEGFPPATEPALAPDQPASEQKDRIFVTVYAGETVSRLTDPERTWQLCQLIETVVEQAGQTHQDQLHATTATQDNSSQKTVRIVIEQDGQQMEYMLDIHRLAETAGNQEYALSSEQSQALYRLLGVSTQDASGEEECNTEAYEP